MEIRSSVIAALAIVAMPAVAGADLLKDYNVIVTGNLTTGAEIEGRTIVGGNLVAGNAENFAIGRGSITPASYAGVDTLVVGGSIQGRNAGDYKVMGGNVEVGGTISNNSVTLNGGGSLKTNDSNAVSIANAAAALLTSASNGYAGMTTNSTVTSSTNGQPSQVTFTAAAGASNGVAVFDVNGSLFSSSTSQSYQLVTNGDTTIVINVHGSSVAFNQGNFLSGFSNNSASVIFNFVDATSVSASVDIFGAILAPKATFTDSSALDGSLFVQNFTQTGEVHLPTFNGYDPASVAVPVPASALMLGLGLPGGLGLARVARRLRRTS